MRNLLDLTEYNLTSYKIEREMDSLLEKNARQAVQYIISQMQIHISQRDGMIRVEICDKDGMIIGKKKVKEKMTYSKNDKYGKRKEKRQKQTLFTREELEAKGIKCQG